MIAMSRNCALPDLRGFLASARPLRRHRQAVARRFPCMRLRDSSGLILLGLACLTLPARLSATENDFGAWLIVSSTDVFAVDHRPSRWRYTIDAQARYFDIGTGINQYLIRPGIGYSVGSNLSAWVGYARFRSRGRAGNVVDENRYWQQLAWTVGRYANGRVTMRTRLEQRSVTAGEDVGLVLRHLTRYTKPLGAAGQTSLVLGIEPIVDLKNTDWGGDSGLGQVRTSLGLSRVLSENLTIDGGYMNQYVLSDADEDRSNHLVVLNFKVGF